MINKICKNISSLIYWIGDLNGCELNSEYIESFITALIPVKGSNDCLSERYLRKVIKDEVKDIEIITLFSIAYSFDISMEKFVLDADEFKEVCNTAIILPKIAFDMCDVNLKKKFIKIFQYELHNIAKEKLDYKCKSKKYILYKKYNNQYIFEILSKKTNKLPRINTISKLLKSIGYEEIDVFIEKLYRSWSKEIEIYYK